MWTKWHSIHTCANSSFQQQVHAHGKRVWRQQSTHILVKFNSELSDWDAWALINLTILSGIQRLVSSNQSDDRLSESNWHGLYKNESHPNWGEEATSPAIWLTNNVCAGTLQSRAVTFGMTTIINVSPWSILPLKPTVQQDRSIENCQDDASLRSIDDEWSTDTCSMLRLVSCTGPVQCLTGVRG